LKNTLNRQQQNKVKADSKIREELGIYCIKSLNM